MSESTRCSGRKNEVDGFLSDIVYLVGSI
jgi:hypothetical protein